MSKKLKNEIIEPELCSICSDRYTNVIRKKIVCKYCNASTCSKCIEHYMLTRHEDAHCLHCRVNYNDMTLQEICTKTYLQQTYYKHRQEVLVNRERANLPGLQDLAQRRKHQQERVFVVKRLMDERAEIKRKYSQIFKEYSLLYNDSILKRINPNHDKAEVAEITKRLHDLHKEMKVVRLEVRAKNQEIWRARMGRGEFRYQDPNHPDQEQPAEEVKEKKKFIRRCARDGCQGFLSTAWKCALCEWYSCPNCFAVKSKEHDAPHECNKEDVEMAEMIKKDSKPCPKCGEFITKSSGCDQMFCICCQTPFSWETGQIVTHGTIHNPHYYEWLRRTGGGTAPRNPADVPCGGYPQAWELVDIFGGRRIEPREYHNAHNHPFYVFHRLCREIQDISLHRYRSHIDQTASNDINVRFLLNEINEKKWGQLLAQVEKKRKRDQEIQEIFGAFRMVAVELINRVQLWRDPYGRSFVYMPHEQADKFLADLQIEIDALIRMINEAFQKMGQHTSASVPQIISRTHHYGYSYYMVQTVKIGKKGTKRTKSKKEVIANESVAAVAASTVESDSESESESDDESTAEDMSQDQEMPQDPELEQDDPLDLTEDDPLDLTEDDPLDLTENDQQALVIHDEPMLDDEEAQIQQAIQNSLM